MPTELRWIINRSVDCFHRVELLLAGRPLTDSRWDRALGPPVADLVAFCHAAECDVFHLLEHLTPLAAGIEPHHEQAELALRKVDGLDEPDDLVSRLAAILADLKHAAAALSPDLLDELELRSGPLREQWEATGPGLLAGFGRRTEPGLVPETVDALLVGPVGGGGGAAHLAYNSVRIEAVLANPHEALPEVVRLAWFVAQLNCDLPKHAEHLAPESVAAVIAAATLPPVVATAADLGLVRDETSGTALALQHWRFPRRWTATRTGPLLNADQLSAWWATYQERRPSWAIALHALQRIVDTTDVMPE